MFSWTQFRRWDVQLQSWLRKMQSRKIKPNFHLDCQIHTKQGVEQTTYLITGAIGLRLQGVPAGRRGIESVRLIDASDACDRQQFWSLWKHFSGEKLRWESGKPFNP